MTLRLAAGPAALNCRRPFHAHQAMSACTSPESSPPLAMPLTFSTEPWVVWATAISPGTPQLPPRSQGAASGGRADGVGDDGADGEVGAARGAGADAEVGDLLRRDRQAPR